MLNLKDYNKEQNSLIYLNPKQNIILYLKKRIFVLDFLRLNWLLLLDNFIWEQNEFLLAPKKKLFYPKIK
jgi:hypothetical protein